jgi:hypothetical protein
MAFRLHETLLNPNYQSHILRCPEGRLFVLSPFAYLKHHLRKFFQVTFFHDQDAENEFAQPFNTLKHRFIDFTKVVFLKRPEGKL